MTKQKQRVKQIMPWFGGDSQSAPAIAAAIGDRHTHYVEPFCGGLSVLFAKPRVKNERVNDLHGGLINLARVVSEPALWEELNERLAKTVWCDDVHAQCCWYATSMRASLETPPQGEGMVDWAWAEFVVAWMGRGGFSGTGTLQGPSRRNDCEGGWSGTRFRSACDSLAWMHERLRTVEITSIDGIELAGAFSGKSSGDTSKLAIFCDPPFIEEGDSYYHNFTSDDHDLLAGALNEYRHARIVVEYHEHDRLEELYPPKRWRRVPLSTSDQIGNNKGRKKSSILLINDAAFEGKGTDQ